MSKTTRNLIIALSAAVVLLLLVVVGLVAYTMGSASKDQTPPVAPPTDNVVQSSPQEAVQPDQSVLDHVDTAATQPASSADVTPAPVPQEPVEEPEPPTPAPEPTPAPAPTTPVQTEPAPTSPPAAEPVQPQQPAGPPAGAPAYTMSVNGTDWTFYLHRARLIGTTIAADYVAYDPRNYPMYQLTVVMAYDIDVGDHNCGSLGISNGPFEVFLYYDRDSETNSFQSFAQFKYRSGSTLSVLERDSSWSTYRISFNANVRNTSENKNFTLVCDDTSFTIGAIIDGESVSSPIIYKWNQDGIAVPRIEASSKSTSTQGGSHTYGTPVATGGSTGSNYSSDLDDDLGDLYEEDFEDDSEPVKCFSCGGSGDCKSCDGDGHMEVITSTVLTDRCRTCEGNGRCIWCDGTGYRKH